MSSKTGYIGMDRFRLVAALLVVAVHTSPLTGFGDLPDYVLTRILARLGVPFFFAATGFFLLTPYAKKRETDSRAICGFVGKTSLLYGVAILLYLPVNLYAGHFSGGTFPASLRLLLVDGTIYHLWYLPASILGVGIVWALLRFWGLRKATVISCFLYCIGLLGDAYYGIPASIPLFKSIYDGIFTVSTYTRNGLFMAPVFLLAGVWAAGAKPAGRKAALTAWLVSMGLLLFEGLLLHGVPEKRHDSMYILLPVCVYFLFCWLKTFTGLSNKLLRTVSLIVYLIHPMVIVAVRGAAKLLGLVPILVENSLIHYFVVCTGSILASVMLLFVKGFVSHVLRERNAARLDRSQHGRTQAQRAGSAGDSAAGLPSDARREG